MFEGVKSMPPPHHGTSCDHNPWPARDTPLLQRALFVLNPAIATVVATLLLSHSLSLFVSLCVYDDHPLPSGACDRYYERACPLARYRSHLVIILDCTERSLRRCAAPDRLYLRFLVRPALRFHRDYAPVSRAFADNTAPFF